MKHSRRIIAVSAVSVICVAIFIIYLISIRSNPVKNKIHNEVNSDGYESNRVQIYDTSAISDAYLSGDSSKLSEFDKSIFEKATEILDKIIIDGMSEYEKELAVHDYLIYNVSYDESLLGVFGGHGENSDNPYGALIDGKAICTGYTSSFQMFMDMLEIPCKSIIAKDSDNDDHAWNMVELDGDWYYVDVTWDDPLPESENSPIHDYFNVTEEYLRENEHCWNSDGLPEANSTKYAYYPE